VHAVQHGLVDALKAGDPEAKQWLLMVEHTPVITLGRRADPRHVLASPAELESRGIQRIAVERGGEVTYHGPGQLVAYPVLNLRWLRKDVRWFSDALLQAMVRTLGNYGVSAEAREGPETGVWVDGAKIGSLGLRVERWVSYHGIALNVSSQLDGFGLVVPCGLPGVRVTSMEDCLRRTLLPRDVAPDLAASLGTLLGVAFEAVDPPATWTG
jgi:lipoate-protein ligase B